MCEALLERGVAGVSILDIDESLLGKAESALRQRCPKVCSFKTDVSKEASLVQAIEKSEAFFGHEIDVFVGNAGIGSSGGFKETSEAALRREMDINFMQHFFAAKHLIPKWTATAEKQRKGSAFIVVSSAAGLMLQIGSIAYTISKRAALSIAEYIAITHGREGVSVVCLCPQAVSTKMVNFGKTAGVAGVDGLLQPSEVAQATVQGLAEGRFLVALPDRVYEYVRRKGDNYDRWVAGMQKLNARFAKTKPKL